jgi:mRNA-degrading endonuclease RelE of RelBE toxin-antitoxin system
MTIEFTNHAKKQLKKLPNEVKKKLQKKLHILKDNPTHPSLHFRKKANSDQ